MKALIGALACSLLIGIPALAQEHDHGAHAAQPAANVAQGTATSAVAVLHPLGESKVKGIVRFTVDGETIKVVAEVEGLPANSTHGFHIHEYGDCSAPDGSSAGSHYNPEGHQHAGPDAPQRHAGDLGNLTSDENGKAKLELTLDGLTINGTKNPIIGRAVIVHEKADDLQSQPTGDAGGRIACGVIGIAK